MMSVNYLRVLVDLNLTYKIKVFAMETVRERQGNSGADR